MIVDMESFTFIGKVYGAYIAEKKVQHIAKNSFDAWDLSDSSYQSINNSKQVPNRSHAVRNANTREESREQNAWHDSYLDIWQRIKKDTSD